ncbi:hypothetical protein ADU59_03090 [Pararhizobium polonicum]|uniref:Uncharacterized protein n=1 Tax=Pararhizobium polonicum TaxID=1612624 RepID=A0A1C7P682_9HYPH|nr:hypothetical protein ADU59_03090 [Pararhizobium polonicum]
MTRRDFSKMRMRQNAVIRGSEPVDGDDLLFAAPRQRKPKAAIRAEANSLISSSTIITKMIECACGHRGRVRIPAVRANGRFKCVTCGRTTR